MIAFNKYYNRFNILSVSLVVVSLFLLTFKGLNFGIDFKGGTLIELRASESKINVSSLRDNLNQMNLGDVSVKKFGNETDFLIKFENNDNKNVIEEIKFTGEGCAISLASASLMTEKLKGKKIEVAEEIFKDFTNLVSGTDVDLKVLNEEDSLYALKGVGGFPMRGKCATMAWHAFNQALKD